jgi:type VI secretion system protein ImpA
METNLDIAALLEPIAGFSPCGADLEYSAEFAALQAAVAGRPEQQVGALIVPAAEPDWHDVVVRSRDLLRRTRDLRIACRLTQALLHVQGLPGLSAGLALVRGCVEDHWDDLYPRLDPEDDFDPAIRVNALALLCNVGAVVHPLRELPLLAPGLAGIVSLRTIARAHGGDGGRSAEPAAPEAADIDAAFSALDSAELQALAAAAGQARDDAAAIETELLCRVGAARALDFGALTRALAEVEGVVAPWLARRRPEETLTAPAGAPADEQLEESLEALLAGLNAPRDEIPPPVAEADLAVVTPAAAQPAATTGPLRSRAEVQRALAEMCSYFERHEPTHPVPILLERAQRWLAMDYMALLRDLAPEAAEQAERLRGASR